MANHSYKWYSVDFDSRWCTCRNPKCRAQRTVESIKGKRKCPECRMNNQLCLPKATATEGRKDDGR